MRIKFTLLLAMIGFGFLPVLKAVDPIPQLIISEMYFFHTEEAYCELTNMGTLPVDLNRVIFAAAQNTEANYRTDTSRWNVQFLTGAGILDPGKSIVVINYRTSASDSTNIYTPSWYLNRDYHWLKVKPGVVTGMRCGDGNDAFGLFWDLDGDNNVDYTIDTLLDEVGIPGRAVTFEVAGVANASLTHTFIRKTTITKGNAGNWIASAGVSSEDSEWIVIPYDPWNLGAMFTTVGNHGNTFTWDFTPVAGTLVNDKFSMPWGTMRDSVFKAIDVGPNMAWHLRWGPDTLESNAIQTGDTLLVYLCGNEVEVRKYPITITEPLENNNIVIPKLSRTASGGYNTPYAVTNGAPVIDTIYSMAYGTRIDTLFTYLEKASNAFWEFKTSDGAVRADIKTGDKLVITAKNGEKKEYYINTDEYSPSSNAYLETILIDNDTLWGFSRNTNIYNIILPAGVQSFPSISATAENNDARVSITQPRSIRGTQEDRTATIRVVAESDTVFFDYKLIFDFARGVQKNVLDPFFSQVIGMASSGTSGFEIFNPSNVPISLSDYMMVRARPDGGANIGSLEELLALRDSSDFDYVLNFGYYHDISKNDQGLYFEEANNYNIDIEPYDVWFIKRYNDSHWGGPDNADYYSLKTDQDDVYGYNDGAQVGYQGVAGYNYWLLKMTNDSILDGTKSADDPDDWKFIDIYGTVGERFDVVPLTIEGQLLVWDAAQHLIRKGNIRKGNTEPFGSLKEADGPGSSEWNIVYGDDFSGPLNDVGRHSGFIKPTNFQSTVTSGTYLVSSGIGNKETIKGVFPSSTVTAFYSKLIKADPEQVLMVMKKNGSGALGASDPVATGDTLVVKSKDLTNTTRYLITTGFLSTDAILTSDLYEIGFSGTTGTIGIVEHFTTINELMSHLTLPAGAFMNIFDNQRRHVPLLHMAPDTFLVIDPIVNDSIFIEVIAEDGITSIKYSLVMTESTEPYLTSNVYYIYQEVKVIDLFVDNTNIKTFRHNIRPSSGATIKIIDKLDFERKDGNMFIDDRVVVTGGNAISVTYTLHGFYDTIRVGDPTSIRGSENGELPKIHSIYPNPAASLLNVGGLETGSKVVVMDILGHVMVIRQAYSSNMEMDLSGYSKGIYFIRVIKDKKSVTYKFIKQ